MELRWRFSSSPRHSPHIVVVVVDGVRRRKYCTDRARAKEEIRSVITGDFDFQEYSAWFDVNAFWIPWILNYMYQASVYSLCIDDVTFWLQAMMRFFFRCILTGSPQSHLIPRAIDRIFLGYEDDESNSDSLSLFLSRHDQELCYYHSPLEQLTRRCINTKREDEDSSKSIGVRLCKRKHSRWAVKSRQSTVKRIKARALHVNS